MLGAIFTSPVWLPLNQLSVTIADVSPRNRPVLFELNKVHWIVAPTESVSGPSPIDQSTIAVLLSERLLSVSVTSEPPEFPDPLPTWMPTARWLALTFVTVRPSEKRLEKTPVPTRPAPLQDRSRPSMTVLSMSARAIGV